MKKQLLSLLLLLASGPSFAQQTSFKGNELYATVNSLKDFDFGLAYKAGLTNDWYLRFDVLNASFTNKKLENTSTTDPNGDLLNLNRQRNSNYDLGVGIERRTEYNTRMEFLYGLSLLGGLNQQSTEATTPDGKMLTDITQSSWSYGAGINLGALVKIADNLLVAGELLPKYLVHRDKTEYMASAAVAPQVQKTSGSTFGFSLSDIRLSLVYRFRR
ncbi:MAG: hypothetical protein LRY55_06225 [Leadbetterella sp.]|nr:hypothetical protein [Leadbetterella sp.]